MAGAIGSGVAWGDADSRTGRRATLGARVLRLQRVERRVWRLWELRLQRPVRRLLRIPILRRVLRRILQPVLRRILQPVLRWLLRPKLLQPVLRPVFLLAGLLRLRLLR